MMEINDREKIGERFIYLVLGFWIVTEALFNTTIEQILFWKKADIEGIISYFILVLLLIQIVFFQEYQMNELIFIGIITVPIVYATVQSNHNTMIATWIFIVAAKLVDFEKLSRQMYWILLIMFVVVLSLCFMGVINDYVIYRGSTVRHSLGFFHPNQLGIRVFQLVTLRCYVRKSHIGIADIILIFLSAYFVKVVSDSKTAYYMLIMLGILVILNIIVRIMMSRTVALSYFSIIVAVAANICSIVFSFIDVRKFRMLNALDSFLSKRFFQCHRTLKFYGLSFFGQDIQKIVKRPIIGNYYRFLLDNAYMAILLRYGIIVYLVFSTLYIVSMIQLLKKNQVFLLEIMCLFAIYGLMENSFFYMTQNIFLLVLSNILYKDKNVEEEPVQPRVRLIFR